MVGLFAAGSHAAVAIPRCAAHHPSLNAAAAAVAAAAAAACTPPYHDASASGRLRYLQLATIGTSEDAPVEVGLVWAEAPPPAGAPLSDELSRLVAALRAAAPPGLLASLWVNYHPGAGNAVTGAVWSRLPCEEESSKERANADADADAFHWERFGGADVAFTPGAFVQANYGAFDALLGALAAELAAASPGCRVVDMYAGTGAIGLSLLASGAAASLTAVEVTAAAAAPFVAAAARLAARDGSAPARMHIAPAGGAAALAALAGGQVLVVDPPRRGLDAGLLAVLCTSAEGGPACELRTLAYVSCGFAALRRDAAALRAGGWALRSARAFQFFPGTDALETLAMFVREPPGLGSQGAEVRADAAAEEEAALPQRAPGGATAAARRRARKRRSDAARAGAQQLQEEAQ